MTTGSRATGELKDNPNLFLMLCGHVHAENERVDILNGNNIRTVLADYQDLPEGGTGWPRFLEFQPALHRIRVLTYSPVLDVYGTFPAARSRPPSTRRTGRMPRQTRRGTSRPKQKARCPDDPALPRRGADSFPVS